MILGVIKAFKKSKQALSFGKKMYFCSLKINAEVA